MIEVILELKLDSFLVNSMGGSDDLSRQTPARALRFICEKISSVRRLTDNTPSVDFEFLGSSSQREIKIESDKEFDEQLSEYLATHTTVDISRVNVASGSSGYGTASKGEGEIGRMFLTKLPDQSRVDIELVLKSDEFDAVWELTTEQKIQKVIATLVCFKLKQGNPAPRNDTIFVAGIISSSLQMMPPASG